MGKSPHFSQALSPFETNKSNICLDELLFYTLLCHANQVLHQNFDI